MINHFNLYFWMVWILLTHFLEYSSQTITIRFRYCLGRLKSWKKIQKSSRSSRQTCPCWRRLWIIKKWNWKDCMKTCKLGISIGRNGVVLIRSTMKIAVKKVSIKIIAYWAWGKSIWIQNKIWETGKRSVTWANSKGKKTLFHHLKIQITKFLHQITHWT